MSPLLDEKMALPGEDYFAVEPETCSVRPST